MEFKVHNTQTEEKSELSASFENVDEIHSKREEDIDFDLIIAEREYFGKDIKHVQVKGFIGDKDESTELDSIVNSMISEVNISSNPFKLATQFEESGTDEILSILKNKPQTCKNGSYVRGLSRSNPEFYNSKKVSLNGKVLQHNNPHRIPERVSNPFFKNFETSKNANFDSFLIKNINTHITSETKPILY